MTSNLPFAAANPFFESYVASDFFGKLIFLALIGLSILSWIVLIYKTLVFRRVKKNSERFQQLFIEQQKNFRAAPLAVDVSEFSSLKDREDPFLDLYLFLKKQALALLNKNKSIEGSPHMGWLSTYDLDGLFTVLQSEGARQIKKLESHLYLLSTVVSLAPFIGLLGTVWGILITFSHMQSQLAGGSQGILQGLSLALTTTVLGLLDAIPALIGYNYLKNYVRDFHVEMNAFTTSLVSAVEMEYRPVSKALEEP